MSSKQIPGNISRSAPRTDETANKNNATFPESGDPAVRVLAAVEEAIRSLEFGTVSVIVQNGVVVQIEKTEKIRFR